VISISWGGPEDSYDQQTLDAMNAALQDAVALGVTVCVASGDSGSTDGEPGRHVDFPGSSPYALCCGGTSLRLNVDGSIESEVVWNDGPQGGESGGGESKVWPRPSYQNSVSTSGWRGVPDVAGNADPDTGYDVIIDGQKGVIGGTSAVAPLWAGLIARISQLQGKPSGFINPTIYPLQATAFNDILLGGNGRYHAKKGWDQCTGLGSPKGGVLVKAL
jgi:kumamolisin